MAVVCSGALFGERPDAQHGRRVYAVGIHHGRDPLQGGEQQSLFPVLQGLEALDEALLQRGGGLGEQGATRVSQVACTLRLSVSLRMRCTSWRLSSLSMMVVAVAWLMLV